MTRPDAPRAEQPEEGRRAPGAEPAGGGSAGGDGAGGSSAAGGPPADHGGHPSEEAVDALLDADLVELRDRRGREGSGPPPEALTAAHVLGCERCRGVLADMRRVRGLLRRQGAGPLLPPDDLAARIAVAVAEDAARERRAARGRRRRSALALAASVVVAAGLSAVLALQVHDAQTGGTAGDGAAGAEDAGAGAGAGALVMASGTDYTLGSVDAQISAVLDDPDGGPAGEAGRAAAAATDPLAPRRPSGLARPEELGSCLTALGRPGADVMAVDTARWQGRPADVLVLHQGDVDPGGHPGLAVWVVQVGCRGGEEALLHYEVVEP